MASSEGFLTDEQRKMLEEPYLLVGSIVNNPSDEYKKAVVSLIEEYFSTGDVDVAASALRKLGSGEYHPYFLKRLVSTAMDRKNNEREMTSGLLSALHIELFSTQDIVNGFVMLLEAAEDTALDVLDASSELSLFLARAVIDEVLDPLNLEEIGCRLPPNSSGSGTLDMAKSLLAAKDKIVKVLEEYKIGGILSEACQCIRDLNMPFFNHEVVKKALVMAIENKNDKMLDLLHECFCEGLITTNQLTKGFTRISDTLDDLALDIPGAEERFNLYVEYAQKKGWLLPSYCSSGTDDPLLPAAAEVSTSPVKKDGGGGSKGTWGNILDTGAVSRIDRNDPNYDSSEEPYLLVGSIVNDPLDEYKKAVVSLIEEYFSTGDVDVAASNLRKLGSGDYHPYFLKRLVSTAIDRKNKEREMTSVLLSALHIELFSTQDIVNGFVMLLEPAEDTALDVLDSSSELSLFLARAVIDEVLDPLNLEEIGCRLPPNCSGSEILDMARSLLAASHNKIVKLLEEYKIGGILSEACQCIRDLNMPFFNHEVVKKALVMAIENKNDKMLDLLHECFCEGLITTNQLTKGFTRISDTLDDLALDIPGAEERFNLYVEYAQKKGWLLPSYCSSGTDDPLLPAASEVSTSPVKKDGGGGSKETWGNILGTGAESRINHNDLDYDSSEEPYLLVGSIVNDPLDEYKKAVVSFIEEYFSTGDVDVAASDLRKLGSGPYHPYFLKRLVSTALDRKNKEREMTSVLLSALHIKLFSTQDIVNGFVMLLEAAEDTALDVPDASSELSLFLARAVIDEVLDPLNLEEIGCRLPPNCSGSEILDMARSLLAASHKIVKLLEEYKIGGILSEACQCIRDLNMPFFNHEVVKKALVMAIENKNDKMLDLLHECFCEGLITTNQLTKGFTRISDTLDDLALDIPGAEERFNLYVEYAQKKGWLLPSYCSSGTDDPLLPAAIETGNAEVSTSPVKKDGAGGKGIWGKLLDPDCESPIDRNELSPTSFLRKCKSQNLHKSVLEVFMEFIKARERPVDEIEVESYKALSCCIQGNSELEPNNIELYEFLAEIIPSKEELQERRELIVRLTNHIKEIWPNAKVVPYGSFGSGLSLKKSDIDLTIFKDGLFKDERDVWTMGVGEAAETFDLLGQIYHLMCEKKMLQVQKIVAKVPIVRFVNPNPRIDVDISLNGLDGFLNTKLLTSIQTFDQRIPNLCALVKNWARVNDLNKTRDGGLSSYSYNLMVMNFCQMRGIALVLHHESMNTFKVKMEEGIRGFREHNSRDMANKTNNRMTLFELLKSFFCYWAREYNYCDDVVSVRMGKTIRRKESQCAGNAKKETIVIEDPFVITKNVCFHLDQVHLEKMRKEFAIAAQLLDMGAKSWIDKYRPSFI